MSQTTTSNLPAAEQLRSNHLGNSSSICFVCTVWRSESGKHGESFAWRSYSESCCFVSKACITVPRQVTLFLVSKALCVKQSASEHQGYLQYTACSAAITSSPRNCRVRPCLWIWFVDFHTLDTPSHSAGTPTTNDETPIIQPYTSELSPRGYSSIE